MELERLIKGLELELMNHWFGTQFNTYQNGKTFMLLVSESNIAHTILYFDEWANWLPILCIASDRDRKGDHIGHLCSDFGSSYNILSKLFANLVHVRL